MPAPPRRPRLRGALATCRRSGRPPRRTAGPARFKVRAIRARGASTSSGRSRASPYPRDGVGQIDGEARRRGSRSAGRRGCPGSTPLRPPKRDHQIVAIAECWRRQRRARARGTVPHCLRGRCPTPTCRPLSWPPHRRCRRKCNPSRSASNRPSVVLPDSGRPDDHHGGGSWLPGHDRSGYLRRGECSSEAR